MTDANGDFQIAATGLSGFLETLVGGQKRTSDDGRFRLTNVLPNSTVQLVAEGQAGRKSQPIEVVVGDGARLTNVGLALARPR